MVPKDVYETLEPEEQKLWHSHEFEVISGMPVAAQPSTEPDADKWEKMETEVMREVAGVYGKTWHFWQVDHGDSLPLGTPQLMGTLTDETQLNLDQALAAQNRDYQVDHSHKAQH